VATYIETIEGTPEDSAVSVGAQLWGESPSSVRARAKAPRKASRVVS